MRENQRSVIEMKGLAQENLKGDIQGERGSEGEGWGVFLCFRSNGVFRIHSGSSTLHTHAPTQNKTKKKWSLTWSRIFLAHTCGRGTHDEEDG